MLQPTNRQIFMNISLCCLEFGLGRHLRSLSLSHLAVTSLFCCPFRHQSDFKHASPHFTHPFWSSPDALSRPNTRTRPGAVLDPDHVTGLEFAARLTDVVEPPSHETHARSAPRWSRRGAESTTGAEGKEVSLLRVAGLSEVRSTPTGPMEPKKSSLAQ